MREINKEHSMEGDWAGSDIPWVLDSLGRYVEERGGDCQTISGYARIEDLCQTISGQAGGQGKTVKVLHHDPVAAPVHYTAGGIECIDYITAKGMNYLEGNIIKYITRYRFKGGVQDLEKARTYLDRLIAQYKSGGR